MSLHLEPIQWILRSYDNGSYEDYSPYSGVLNIFRISQTEAVAFAAHGKFDKNLRTFLINELNKHGITTLHFVRKGHKRAIHA